MATLLEQLRGMTTVVSDTGDINAITNPTYAVIPMQIDINKPLCIKATTWPN